MIRSASPLLAMYWQSFCISLTTCLTLRAIWGDRLGVVLAANPRSISSFNLTSASLSASGSPLSEGVQGSERARDAFMTQSRSRGLLINQSFAIGRSMSFTVGFDFAHQRLFPRYVMEWLFGTPHQAAIKLTIDTGRNLILVPGSPDVLADAGDPYFKAESSITYQKMFFWFSDCPTLHLNGTTLCTVGNIFPTSEVCAYLASDKCTCLNSTFDEKGGLFKARLPIAVFDLVVGLSKASAGPLPPMFPSAGLGRGNLSLSTVLAMAPYNLPNAFSFCFLEHNATTRNKTSLLEFGDAALSHVGRPFMNIIPLLDYNNDYVFNILKIDFATYSYIPSSIVNADAKTKIDTGTSLTYFPGKIYDSMRIRFQNLLTARYHLVRLPEDPDLVCVTAPTFPKLWLPQLSLWMRDVNGDFAQILLGPQNYMFLLDDNATACVAVKRSSGPTSSIGAIFLQNVRIVIDKGGKVMHIGRETCG